LDRTRNPQRACKSCVPKQDTCMCLPSSGQVRSGSARSYPHWRTYADRGRARVAVRAGGLTLGLLVPGTAAAMMPAWPAQACRAGHAMGPWQWHARSAPPLLVHSLQACLRTEQHARSRVRGRQPDRAQQSNDACRAVCQQNYVAALQQGSTTRQAV
jgi:hypothetical protein